MKTIIDWETYFISLAHLSALRSKDPSTQVGAVIVDNLNKIVSIGYNGLPRGCEDNQFPWGREGEFLKTKYPFVVHAELNAILNATRSVIGCTIYVSLFPCNECAKAIIQSGIKKVVYSCDKYAETDQIKASKMMFKAAGVELHQLDFDVEVAVNKVSL